MLKLFGWEIDPRRARARASLPECMNRKHLHNTEVSPVLTDKDSAEPIQLPTGKEIRKAYQLSRVMGLASLHLPRRTKSHCIARLRLEIGQFLAASIAAIARISLGYPISNVATMINQVESLLPPWHLIPIKLVDDMRQFQSPPDDCRRGGHTPSHVTPLQHKLWYSIDRTL